jgi:hypothetical protein
MHVSSTNPLRLAGSVRLVDYSTYAISSHTQLPGLAKNWATEVMVDTHTSLRSLSDFFVAPGTP